MATASPKRIRAEARALRDLLAGATGATFSEIELEPDARPHVVALWEGLGWSKLYEECQLAHPALERGRERAFARVTEWNRGKMSKLTRRDLPAKFRVVYDDGAGVGFQIADETQPGAEPRLLGVICDTSQIVPERDSYSRAVVAPIIARLWPGLHRLSLHVAPPDPAGRQLFPTLAPEVQQLVPGLFSKQFGSGQMLYFARHSDLFAWLRQARPTIVAMTALSNNVLYPTELADKLIAKVRDMLEIPTASHKHRVFLGTLGRQEVLVSISDVLNASISSADPDSVHALLQSAPTSRTWAAPDTYHHAPVYVDTAVDAPITEQAFASAVANLQRIAAVFAPRSGGKGAAQLRAVPADLPARPRRILEALAASSVTLSVPSIKESNVELEHLFEKWKSARELPEGGWFQRGIDLAAARRELPERGRLVHGSSRDPTPIVLFTDEDGAADDPPVLAVSPQWQRVYFGHPTLSSVLVALALEYILDSQLKVPLAASSDRTASRPLAPVAQNVVELAPGVIEHGRQLYFASSDAFVAFDQGDEPRPPDDAERFLPKRKAAFLPEALAKSDNFRSYVLTSRYKGPPIECAFGRINGVPVWVTTRRNTIEILFLAEHRSLLEPWLEKAGSLLPPKHPRLY